MKSFIVVGSNNYWYGYLRAETMDEAQEEIKEIKQSIDDEEFCCNSKPDELYLYQITDARTFKL